MATKDEILGQERPGGETMSGNGMGSKGEGLRAGALSTVEEEGTGETGQAQTNVTAAPVAEPAKEAPAEPAKDTQSKQAQTPPVPEYHGKVIEEYGDYAIMEDGTIRTNGIAGPIYTKPKSYEQQFKLMNFRNRPLTPEEEEKRRKKEKRDKLFAAIGDGVMALSNLFFTTQGAPSMYTGRHTMSQKTRERYEKLTKDDDEQRRAYMAGILKAREADQRREQAEREWQRQLGLDERNEERYKEEQEHKRKREKIADDRYAAEQEYRRQRDAVGDDKWQKTYDEGRRRANQSHALAVQTQQDNKELRRQQIAATGARAMRGKQLAFSDGNGNQVSIYENVWKGSMQQVYDALAEDMKAAYEADKKNNPRVPRHKTASEKADFVKQNWHRSPRAAAIMLSLSKLDPATMHSGLSDDGGDVEDYVPSGSDEKKSSPTAGNQTGKKKSPTA